MSIASQQFLGLTATGIGIVLISMALRNSHKAWTSGGDPRDFALSWTAGIWLHYLFVVTVVELAVDINPTMLGLRTYSGYLARMGFHALTVSIVYFLLTCAGLSGIRMHVLVAVQAVAGAAVITVQQLQLSAIWPDGIWNPPNHAWITIDLIFSSVVILAMAQRLQRTRNQNGWLALATGIVGLGLLTDSILLAEKGQDFRPLSHYFFAAFLLLMCRLLTRQDVGESTGIQQGSAFEPFTVLPSNNETADFAIATDRRRIAQDLHDGVGSQLTIILSSLDIKVPHQQTVALALEQCMIDLKMTIDAIDSQNDSLPDALGRLRYRVQHSLDKLGIHMHWEVDVCPALETLRGEPARHALRIAQESLANVIRHADASSVRVRCCVDPSDNLMILEVQDDGKGIAPERDQQPMGKGLQGMRQRARDAGGSLGIYSALGCGTQVKLTLPLTAAARPLAAPVQALVHSVAVGHHRRPNQMVIQSPGA